MTFQVYGYKITDGYGVESSNNKAKMSGRRVGQKVFDWTKLAATVPEGVKTEFGAFRNRHETCKAR